MHDTLKYRSKTRPLISKSFQPNRKDGHINNPYHWPALAHLPLSSLTALSHSPQGSICPTCNLGITHHSWIPLCYISVAKTQTHTTITFRLVWEIAFPSSPASMLLFLTGKCPNFQSKYPSGLLVQLKPSRACLSLRCPTRSYTGWPLTALILLCASLTVFSYSGPLSPSELGAFYCCSPYGWSSIFSLSVLSNILPPLRSYKHLRKSSMTTPSNSTQDILLHFSSLSKSTFPIASM